MFDEDEQPKENQFEVQGYSTERIVFENLLFMQINRVNSIWSQMNEHSMNIIRQFNRAVESLDMTCEPLKDEQFEKDTKPIMDDWHLIKEGFDKMHKEASCPLDASIVSDKKAAYYAHFNKQLYRKLLQLLQRKGRLFKTMSEGII